MEEGVAEGVEWYRYDERMGEERMQRRMEGGKEGG